MSRLAGLAALLAAACSSDAGGDPDAGIAPVELVRVSDVLNAHDGSDVEVAFSAPSNSAPVAEYRILVVPEADAAAFDTAAALAAAEYTSVDSSGAPFGTRLDAGARAVTGDPIARDTPYQVFVLSVAGEASPLPDALSAPSRTLVLDDSSDILVSSRTTHSVKRFDGQTGRFLGDFVGPGDNGLDLTQEVLIGPDDQVYVTGRGTAAVLRYDVQDGTFLGNFTSGYTLDNATKTRFGPDGYLYVAQWGPTQSSVVRFDATTGVFVDEITPDLGQPMDQAWDDTGVLYVAGFDDGDVRRFDTDGTELAPLITTDLTGPVNLMFTGDGGLLVVDWTVGQVKRFDAATGELDRVLITGMTRSEGIVVGHDGYFYVCDWQDNEVNRYTASGAFVDEFVVTGGLQQPNSVTFRAGSPAQ